MFAGAAAPGRLVPGELADNPTKVNVPAQPAAVDGLAIHIVVITGDKAVNILSRDASAQPVVQVCNKNNEPVAGAAVTFRSPNNGPGTLFLNGSHSMTVMTDSAGRAGVVGMKPAGTGAFQMSVSASFHGQIALTTIAQANYATVAEAAAAGVPGYSNGGQTASTGAARAGMSNRAKGGLIAGAAAAAVLVGVLALSHGGGGNSASPAVAIPTASIGVAGPPTTGAPH